MKIPRAATPLVRTTLDLPLDRADRGLVSPLFSGWGVDVPSNRII